MVVVIVSEKLHLLIGH